MFQDCSRIYCVVFLGVVTHITTHYDTFPWPRSINSTNTTGFTTLFLETTKKNTRRRDLAWPDAQAAQAGVLFIGRRTSQDFMAYD